jgi:hypothetical protein
MEGNKRCPSCGKPNRALARFCGHCGKPFAVPRLPTLHPLVTKNLAGTLLLLLLGASAYFGVAALVRQRETPAEAIVGEWRRVTDPAVRVEFFPDGTFLVTTAPQTNVIPGKWKILDATRLRLDTELPQGVSFLLGLAGINVEHRVLYFTFIEGNRKLSMSVREDPVEGEWFQREE